MNHPPGNNIESAGYYLYILRTAGGRLYTGYTTDPVRRLKEHQAGKVRAARFTRAFSPEGFAACWRLACSRSEVLKVEAAVKKLSRRRKLMLVKGDREMACLAAESCGRAIVLRREENGVIEEAVPRKHSGGFT